MRRKDKPFVLYSRGPLSFTIVPRGLAGWVQFALWLASLAPLVIWFEDHITSPAGQATFGGAVALFVAGMLIWFVCGLWWMLGHAEVVDLSEHLRDKQRARRKAQRRRDGSDNP